jgi:hypothetical protein
MKCLLDGSLHRPTPLPIFLPTRVRNMSHSIFLTPEAIHQALDSSRSAAAPLQWQTYLRMLALKGFEAWLQQRSPELDCQTMTHLLQVRGILLHLAILDSIEDDRVALPRSILETTAPDFYVLVEVMEEQGRVEICGALSQVQLQRQDWEALEQDSEEVFLPLSWFELEPNQLLLYLRCLEPMAATQPQPVPSPVVNLSQWLEGQFDQLWNDIESLFTPPLVLQWRSRDHAACERVRIVDWESNSEPKSLAFRLAPESVAVVVSIALESKTQREIAVQIRPTKNRAYLPNDLAVRLLDGTRQELSQAKATQSNSIQFELSGQPGEQFYLELSLGDRHWMEAFMI